MYKEGIHLVNWTVIPIGYIPSQFLHKYWKKDGVHSHWHPKYKHHCMAVLGICNDHLCRKSDFHVTEAKQPARTSPHSEKLTRRAHNAALSLLIINASNLCMFSLRCFQYIWYCNSLRKRTARDRDTARTWRIVIVTCVLVQLELFYRTFKAMSDADWC